MVETQHGKLRDTSTWHALIGRDCAKPGIPFVVLSIKSTIWSFMVGRSRVFYVVS